MGVAGPSLLWVRCGGGPLLSWMWCGGGSCPPLAWMGCVGGMLLLWIGGSGWLLLLFVGVIGGICWWACLSLVRCGDWPWPMFVGVGGGPHSPWVGDIDRHLPHSYHTIVHSCLPLVGDGGRCFPPFVSLVGLCWKNL